MPSWCKDSIFFTYKQLIIDTVKILTWCKDSIFFTYKQPLKPN